MTRLISLPARLRDLLTSPAHLKIGHDLGRSDTKKLFQDFRIFMKNTVDLYVAAREIAQFDRNSLAHVTSATLGLYLNKKMTLSNWECPELSPDQVIYAATDAWVTLQAYNVVADPEWEGRISFNLGIDFDEEIRAYLCPGCDDTFSDVAECASHCAETAHGRVAHLRCDSCTRDQFIFETSQQEFLDVHKRFCT